MNKRDDLLDKISDAYINFHDMPSKAFLNIIADYYKKVDFELDTNYSDIFFELYLCKDKLSFDDIVAKFSIGLSTLDRYRLRFNRLAYRLLPNMQKL